MAGSSPAMTNLVVFSHLEAAPPRLLSGPFGPK